MLVQGKGSIKADDPQVTAAVKDVVSRLEAIPGITEIESPLDAADRANTVSKDGRSVVVNFTMPGTDEHVEKLVDQPLAAVAAAQKAHPGVRVEQFGDVSATKEIAAQDAKDGKKSQLISYGLMLIILLVAFGAFVAAGLPLVLGATAVAATVGLLGPVSQLYALAARRRRARRDHRPRRRRRLRDVLLAPHDGGARPRPLGRGRAGDRRRHVGPRGAHLRA